MKRRITISIALVLSIGFVSLVRPHSSVDAQNQIRIVADSGVIALGPNQFLRITAKSAGGTFNFRFRELGYEPITLEAGVTTLGVTSQTTSDLITVMQGDAVSIDFRRCIYPICGGVRAIVLSNSRDLKVNAAIIDTVTGEVVACVTDLVIDVSG